MGNLIKKTNNNTLQKGNDIEVINVTVKPEVTGGDKLLIKLSWIPLGIPRLMFWIKCRKTKAEFEQLEQKIQAQASQVDNYLEQRVQILSNVSALLTKAINIDKDILTTIAKYRSGVKGLSSTEKAQAFSSIEGAMRGINIQLENYPDLKSHASVANAMQEAAYTQREITAAREAYNDAVYRWNKEIFTWLAKKWVAAHEQYETRIPYAVSESVKAEARKVFF